jgi:hypothetical protein
VECRRTPVYIVTTENHQAPSITLSRIRQSKIPNDPTLPSESGNQGFLKRGRQTPELEPIRRTKRRRKLSPMDDVSQSASHQYKVEREPKLSSDTHLIDNDQVSVTSVLTEALPLPEEYDLKSLAATTSDGDLRLPHVLISIALDEDQILNIDACSEWLASFPALAQFARVQSVYRSYSTLLIISLPVVLWDLLPEEPACSFIGYVKSEDVLTKGARPGGKYQASTKGDLAGAVSSMQRSHNFPVWQSQSSNADIHTVPMPAVISRPPSASGSVSARSMSPTSGNAMRLPGADMPPFSGPSAWGDHLQKRRPSGASPIRSSIDSGSQDDPRISGFSKDSPKSKKPIQNASQPIKNYNFQHKPESPELQMGSHLIAPPAKKSRTNMPWTPEEEQRLKTMREAGNSWADIAKVGLIFSF